MMTVREFLETEEGYVHPFPDIVTLCGSTRFFEEFQRQALRFTLHGAIVLSIGVARARDEDDPELQMLGPAAFEAKKVELDALHKRKIDLSDFIFVLNVGGYIGSSTRSEIEYAQARGVPVEYLETPS